MPSWLINQTSLAAQRLVSEGLDAVGARRSHYSLLAALEEGGPDSQAALGRRCGIDRSDMVPLVNELADRKLIERAPDPTDRRRNIVSITPAGVRHLRDLDAVLVAVQDELLAPLSAVQRARLVRMLTVIVDHHSKD